MMFISFEGIDGSGKTTQAKLLQKYFWKQGIACELVRDPGGTVFSEKIRSLILDKALSPNILTETLLFSASRSELIEKKIKPLLASEVFVIVDRFIDSTIAYQGYGHGQHKDLIEMLNRTVLHGLSLPTITFYLDIDVSTAMRRLISMRDRMESHGNEFFERVRRGYLEISKQDSNRFVLLDATKQPDELHKLIVLMIKKRFPFLSHLFSE